MYRCAPHSFIIWNLFVAMEIHSHFQKGLFECRLYARLSKRGPWLLDGGGSVCPSAQSTNETPFPLMLVENEVEERRELENDGGGGGEGR